MDIDRQLINQLIHRINDKINTQVNAILHHPCLMNLESAWRNCHVLASQISSLQSRRIKLKVLNVSLTQLQSDLIVQHAEFDQTALYDKIVTDTFERPGGEPFSIVVGNYDFHHETLNGVDSIGILHEISKVMSSAMTVFIAAADSKLVDLDSWSNLKTHHQYESLVQQKNRLRWMQFKKSESARFVALTAPKILLRRPYQQSPYYKRNVFFKEHFESHQDYLWGNPSFAYASAILNSFSQSGWFLNIRAPLTQPPCDAQPYCRSENSPNIAQQTVETLITDSQEKKLNQLGIIVLRQHQLKGELRFYTHPSHHRPPSYDIETANWNAHLSAQLPYLLCASRFSQTIKIILRDKVGSFATTDECRQYLLNWIHRYCSSNQQNKDSIHLYPLQEVDIQFQNNHAEPDQHFCIIRIKPHCFIETIDSSLKITSQVSLNATRRSDHVTSA